MSNLNILILSAASRSVENNSEVYPACLMEENGTSLLEKIINNTKNIKNAEYTYAFLENDIKKFHLDKISNLLTPNSNCIRISEGCQGASCTALYSACQLNHDSELLILSANEIIDLDYKNFIDDFRKRDLDAGTITFKSVHPHYSYVRLNKGLVVEAAQRKPISQDATAGIFWFKSTRTFVNSAMKQILKGASTNDLYFIAPCFNELILEQLKIGVFNIDNSIYSPYKQKPTFTIMEK